MAETAISKIIKLTNSFQNVHTVTTGNNFLMEKIRATNSTTAGTVTVKVTRSGVADPHYIFNGEKIGSSADGNGILTEFGERYLSGDQIEAKADTSTAVTLILSGIESTV